MSRAHRYFFILLILLAATALRLHEIDTVPPGMTHDEADHGLDAWGVVQGVRPLYFTVGYGREPFFDYSTALLMSFLGPSFLAGRLTSIYFSLLLIAGSYAWIRRAFGAPIALLAAAGLATGFWPLMTARHALRTVTMPALFVPAVLLFWRALTLVDEGRARTAGWHFLGAGALLGLTVYTYMPARIMWAIFPLFLLYRLVRRRPAPIRGVGIMLLAMALVAAPLLIFLAANPGAEARLDQLSGPLRTLARGDWRPLLDNVRGGLQLLTVEGDTLWRYNIAGRPFLTPAMGALFYLGLALAGWRVIISFRGGEKVNGRQEESREAAALALFWLAAGLSPALITGPEASTTRAIAMQPVLYLFPALALTALGERAEAAMGGRATRILAPIALLLFGLLGAQTAHLYFAEWAPRPEVQVQYEAELVAAISNLDGEMAGPVAISTDEPNRFHDPATARLFLDNDKIRLGWFDGRSSLLLPQDPSARLVLTSRAPLHPALRRYLPGLDLAVAESDPAQKSTIHVINGISTFHSIYPQFSPQINNLSTELSTELIFGGSIRYLGYELVGREEGSATVQAGEIVRLATLWQVERPLPASWILFTHILGPDGQPVAQVDRLDVPSAYWSPGDAFVQLHEIALPADLPAGSYDVAIGFYTLPEWQERLPVTVDGAAAGDFLILPPLDIRG